MEFAFMTPIVFVFLYTVIEEFFTSDQVYSLTF